MRLKGKRIIIKTIDIVYYVLTLLLIQPPLFGRINLIDNYFYDFLLPIAFVGLLLITIIKKIWNKFLLFMILFYASILLPTILNNGDITNFVLFGVEVFSFALFVNYGIYRDNVRFLKIVGNVFQLYSIINILTIVFYPQGLYDFASVEHSWFLGHKNNMVKYLLLGLLFNCLPALIDNNKLKMINIVYIVIMYMTIIMTGSSTSLIALSILLLCAIASLRQWKISKKINIFTGIFVNVAFFVGVVVLRIQEKFSYLIEVILKKNLNFTGRTSVWDNILRLIYDRPFFGYGIEDIALVQNKIEYSNVSAHNLIADYWYQGGIICLFILLYMFIICQLKLRQNFKGNLKVIYFIQTVFFSFSIIFMTETFIKGNFIFIAGMLLICYDVGHLFIKKNVE